MIKMIFLLLLFWGSNYAQFIKAEKVTGSVKAQALSSENWVDVKDNDELKAGTVIMTGKNSSIILKTGDTHFTLKESSALPVSSLKKMSTDELLLALAMENILNAPKNNGGNKSQNTAVYGSKTGLPTADVPLKDNSESFGIKRINGAVQLAENGFKESAVITAKETYRKYPGTKKQFSYRIYFADILYECGLYAEALDEYTEIKKLNLTDMEKAELDKKLDLVSKKLAIDQG
ncbi:MAG TPA: hypothetical protein VMT35_07380 [Ignavibacteriaceae bacterium]|nr:hypothetical protein [Ignavibacteriaceae bacterium]